MYKLFTLLKQFQSNPHSFDRIVIHNNTFCLSREKLNDRLRDICTHGAGSGRTCATVVLGIHWWRGCSYSINIELKTPRH